ncbi:MAG: 4-hydroxybenzoate octaprenyltransferase [Planctomycetota bacterium]
MWEKFTRFLELIRFSHTIFALPFALLASFWAWMLPSPIEGIEVGFRWQHGLGILLCMVFARSFAMAVNRLLDQKWDGENPRTANRHLPARLLQAGEVSGFAAGCGLGFKASTLLFWPNRLPLLLSLPVLLFLGGYSLGKRFTWMVHAWLGVALMLAPVCAWIALRGQIVQQHPWDLLPAVLLGMVVLFWVSGFDILYACQDTEFDRRAGLYSVPARFGVRGALNIAKTLHFLMWVTALAMTFWVPALSLGIIFRLALLGVGALLIYEHSVVSERSLDRMQLAFFQLNSIISVVILGAGALDTWLG